MSLIFENKHNDNEIPYIPLSKHSNSNNNIQLKEQQQQNHSSNTRLQTHDVIMDHSNTKKNIDSHQNMACSNSNPINQMPYYDSRTIPPSLSSPSVRYSPIQKISQDQYYYHPYQQQYHPHQQQEQQQQERQYQSQQKYNNHEYIPLKNLQNIHHSNNDNNNENDKINEKLSKIYSILEKHCNYFELFRKEVFNEFENMFEKHSKIIFEQFLEKFQQSSIILNKKESQKMNNVDKSIQCDIDNEIIQCKSNKIDVRQELSSKEQIKEINNTKNKIYSEEDCIDIIEMPAKSSEQIKEKHNCTRKFDVAVDRNYYDR